MSRISVQNVEVCYPVLRDQYRSIRRAFLRKVTGGGLYGADQAISMVHALKDVSFELNDGDRLGLIGRNGAGKSTLLSTLGGLIRPSSGRVVVEGTVTTLFRVDGGMDVERTGLDNIFMMGRLLGISRNEMEKCIPDIRDFSELGEFLSLPVRSYSAGMMVRLGMAIVTCVKPDILLLDEVIGAGDAHFIEKATKRAHTMYDRANIIVMASHATKIMETLCNKAMWLEHGRIVMFGGMSEVLAAYMNAAEGGRANGKASVYSGQQDMNVLPFAGANQGQ